jgi:hypothetical protein
VNLAGGDLIHQHRAMGEGGNHSGLVIGLVCGVGIWLLSPLLARHAEPWDASGGYYPGALLLAGALGGWTAPRQVGRVVVGVFAGQVLVLLGRVVVDPTNGGLWPLGIVFLGIYSVPVLVGAVVAAIFRRRRERRAGSRPE